MNKILEKRVLTPNVVYMKVDASRIAKKAEPGQFVMIMPNEKSERIPLTIADYDREEGSISIIFQTVGATTLVLSEMNVGDEIYAFTGPLGTPSHTDGIKKVAVIGGGLGCAIAYPQAKKLHSLGANVDIIAGFRNKDIVILEDEMTKASDRLFIMTDDGSNGHKGFVTDKLKELLESGEKYDEVIAIGPLVMMKFVCKLTKEYGVKILPVDSEHSAIFQCLQGCRDRGEIKRLILTCSGGPFYGLSLQELATKTKADALKHPNWTMGAKITIDSATLMNKGLEIIEAMRLYRLPLRQVDAVIHRQSIVHSLVEFHDGAMLAQLGTPDMKLPIRYAMTYPNRAVSPAEPLDLLKCPPLTFAEPDEEVFRCLKIAKQCAAIGNVYCAAMNGANEEAVAAFLRDEIGICAIPDLIEAALDKTETVYQPQLSDILEADRLAREVVREKLN